MTYEKTEIYVGMPVGAVLDALAKTGYAFTAIQGQGFDPRWGKEPVVKVELIYPAQMGPDAWRHLARSIRRELVAVMWDYHQSAAIFFTPSDGEMAILHLFCPCPVDEDDADAEMASEELGYMEAL